MNTISALPDTFDEETDTYVSLLSIRQSSTSNKEKTLLRIMINDDGQFDVIQYGQADVCRNLIYCFRSVEDPEAVMRVSEADLRDCGDGSIVERIASMMELE